ncbi:MAG: ABC transporter substrate-binding protein [Methanomicrobiales archaeon]|nr:ABC transporter substrate-binding protein [Methanomicrobiales archaeon]
MQQLTLFRGILIAGGSFIVLILLLIAGYAPVLSGSAGTSPGVSLLYASAGTMPQLLNTGQIDAFLIWEPVVSNAELSGIGRRIAVPADLPPPGKWDNAAINVLVLRKNIIRDEPEVAALLSALTTAAIERTEEEPALAEKITAAWVFGDKPILTPVGSLEPLDVERHSFANMVFSAEATLPDSDIVESAVEAQGMVYDPASMTDPFVGEEGGMFLNGSRIPRPGGNMPLIQLGYIPSTDNYAPLYVMVKDASYFCDRYGFCLVPDNPAESRPVACTLMVNGTKKARVRLVPGQSGGGILTSIGQDALDGAYVGSVPAMLQIGLGNPSSVIQSINTGGSGLVVAPSAPCTDWPGFVRWAEGRSIAGRPLVIATVQSSIQEDMVREAFEYENITVTFYGTDITIGAA